MWKESKSKMNLFKRIFQSDNKKTQLKEQKTNSETIIIKNNSAFEYVKNKYENDCNIYRKLSSTIHAHSIAAANEFAEVIKGKSNENLIHFFFDYFLCFYVTAKHEYFYFDNKDAYSAIIDGLHIEFYGNVSDEIIESNLELLTTQNKCFLKTDIAAFKNKDIGDRTRLMITIASHCAGKENIGATQVLSWIEPFKHIQNSKLSSIDTFFKIFKNH